MPFVSADLDLTLVMDDDRDVREAVAEMLRSFGYTPVLAPDGAEAIAFLAAERAAGRALAGMIFDLTIPGGMGGKEAIGAVRHFEVTPGNPGVTRAYF